MRFEWQNTWCSEFSAESNLPFRLHVDGEGFATSASPGDSAAASHANITL